MKKKLIIFTPVVIVAIIVARMLFVSCQQKEEFSYHEKLPKTIKFWSGDFANNGNIPVECTGLGTNTSPSLYWDNLPVNTKSLAIMVVDYDAPAPWLKIKTIDHWIVFNISPGKRSLPKGVKGIQLAKEHISLGENITGGGNFAGPNPPIGTHRYYFRIYALSVSRINMTNPTQEELFHYMDGKILAYGELIGISKK